MFKLTAVIGALVASLALAATASASVTLNSNGTGFVGKGDVQIAYGWNNAQLQSRAAGVTFTSQQAASQSLSQSASQVGTMAVTQSVSRDVSCVVTVGGVRNPQTFHRDGTRSGERTGSRDGSRTGSRSGTLAGTLLSSIAYDARTRNQITGFNLRGFSGTPVFTATGANEFGAWEYEDYQFGAAIMGDTEWGGWQAESGANPADCLSGNENVTELSDVTTEGALIDGAVSDGAITENAVVYGAATPTGAIQLYVNYGGVPVLLPITPVV